MKRFTRILTTAGLSLIGAAAASIPSSARAEGGQQQVREIRIVVDGGYEPNRVEIVQGERVQLKFVRNEAGDCTREVVFPALGIRKELPEGKPVVIQLPALAPGEYEFKCGMNMIKGKLVVRARS